MHPRLNVINDYYHGPSLALSYSYISTPLMVLGSSTDTNTVNNVCQVCGEDKCTATLAQTWRDAIDLQAREMITVSFHKTSIGKFL